MNTILERLQGEIARSLQGLDASQTQLRPSSRPAAAESWSIQQIMEHLLLTYSTTASSLDARLAKGAPTRAQPSLWQRLAHHAVFRLGYFPSGRQAPPLVTPSASTPPLTGQELARAAAEHLNHLDRRCAQAAEIFGASQRCASHMVLGPLSPDQWRKFQLVHGKHHLRQIAAIRKAHGLSR